MVPWHTVSLINCGLMTLYVKISGTTLARVMVCCLTAPTHYPNQGWLIISEVLWPSPEGNFIRNSQYIHPWYLLKITNSRLQPPLPGKGPISWSIQQILTAPIWAGWVAGRRRWWWTAVECSCGRWRPAASGLMDGAKHNVTNTSTTKMLTTHMQRQHILHCKCQIYIPRE